MRVPGIFQLLLIAAAVAAGQDSFKGVKRIVAVGDVHGGYEEFVSILRSAGVVNESNQWSGGETHLVQTGDCVDRGPESRKVLDLLMSLESEAKLAGGRVHSLLGNHEAMNIYGDLRYVSPGEYESYKGADWAEARDKAYEKMADPVKKEDSAYRKKWYAEHPPGWVEHRMAFGPEGRYGKTLRERNAIVKINNTLFLHGGIGPKYASTPMSELNQTIRKELKDFKLLERGVTIDPEGPLWYRGLASEPEATFAEFVDTMLTSFGVSQVAIGHTFTTGAVTPRFSRRVILIDVGLSKGYNQSPACLLIEGGKFFALHRGTKLELPSGKRTSIYLRQAAELDPPGTNLRKMMQLP